MPQNKTEKSFQRRMLPRVAKAAIKGVLYLILLYVIPMLIVAQLSAIAPDMFSTYTEYLAIFAAIVIFSAVASELTAGTIYQHAFNIGRAIILIFLFIAILQGGIVRREFMAQGLNFHFVVDLRVYLAMLISIDLLSLGKSVLQAVNFLSHRVEQQYPAPQPSEDV